METTQSSFTNFTTSNGINLHISKNTKFKTNLIQLYIVQPLQDELQASKTALIPSVLFRGSRQYPTYRELVLKLEELYGASLNSSILKRGENQLIRFSMELVNERYMPVDEELLSSGIQLLYNLIFEPLVENNKFNSRYVIQEKELLAERIKSLFNDKYVYAIERCFNIMCQNEPYGIYKLGSTSSLKKINEENLYLYYRDLIKNNPIDIVIIGDIEEERVCQGFNDIFGFEHQQELGYDNTLIKNNVEKDKRIIEEADVKQGKLSLGFRTGITRKDDLYFALQVYNGILGGFPHSKLFQNVREKTSMAYYVHSSLESTKGLLLITSGIQSENFEQARDIILEQISDIAKGKITDKEFKWTKKGLINQFKSTADSNRGMASHFLLGLINERQESIATMIEKINNVSMSEVVEVASNIKLDTTYFLTQRGLKYD